MKKSLLLIPLLALGLFSCSNKETPTNPEEDKPTIPETTFIWSESTDKLMKDHLDGHIVPKMDLDASSWKYDAEYDCISYEGKGDNKLVDTLYNNLKDMKGFEATFKPGDVDEYYLGELTYSFEDPKKDSYISYQVYSDNKSLFLDVYRFDFYREWNTLAIKDLLELVGLDSLVLPEPSFEFEFIETIETDTTSGVVSIYIKTAKDESLSYIDSLTKAGYIDFQDESLGDIVFKTDSEGKVLLDVYYIEEYKEVCIDIYSLI